MTERVYHESIRRCPNRRSGAESLGETSMRHLVSELKVSQRISWQNDRFCPPDYRTAPSSVRSRPQVIEREQGDTLHCIAREQEVVYRDDAIVLDIQCDEISWRLERDRTIIHQHRRATIDGTRRKGPLVGRRIATVILPDLAFPLFAQLGNEVELDVVGQHCADCIEVTGPESID